MTAEACESACRFEVLTGGHSPEQVMLHCPADRLLLCADQVLARILPNTSVRAMDPDGDPLGIYLRSLAGAETDGARRDAGGARPLRRQGRLDAVAGRYRAAAGVPGGMDAGREKEAV